MWNRVAWFAALVVLGVLALSVEPAGAGRSRSEVTAAPALYPAFNPLVPNYVVRCMRGRPVQVSVSVPTGVTASVDGRASHSGSYKATISVSSGQAFRFSVFARGRDRTYTVRCLPSDFPRWTAHRFGRPQAAWYVVAPCCSTRYVAIFDNNGVPVWWLHTRRYVADGSLLPDGDFAVGEEHGSPLTQGVRGVTFEEFHLNGSLERSFSIPDGFSTDRHELQVLPNGDYFAVAYVPRSGVDLRPYGGPANATVLDALIVEVSPQHKIIWSWDSKDHISLSDTSSRWYPLILHYPARLADGHAAYDIVHINAVAPYRGRILVSLRHTDAIYDIDKRSGDIAWKLGGIHTGRSLRIIGDDVPDFGGQHDVRILPDGTITLHDNGTGLARPARALRFSIDARTRTATLLEQIVDHQTPYSWCCGSVRKLPHGDWVITWGGWHVITELTPTGRPVFDLDFPQSIFYRAPPVLPGVLSRHELNAAMDSAHPRP